MEPALQWPTLMARPSFAKIASLFAHDGTTPSFKPNLHVDRIAHLKPCKSRRSVPLEPCSRGCTCLFTQRVSANDASSFAEFSTEQGWQKGQVARATRRVPRVGSSVERGTPTKTVRIPKLHRSEEPADSWKFLMGIVEHDRTAKVRVDSGAVRSVMPKRFCAGYPNCGGCFDA